MVCIVAIIGITLPTPTGAAICPPGTVADYRISEIGVTYQACQQMPKRVEDLNLALPIGATNNTIITRSYPSGTSVRVFLRASI